MSCPQLNKVATLCLSLMLGICAVSNIAAEDVNRIVGGSQTSIETYPFMVFLRLNGNFQCGGALITPTLVLTAGHCIFGTQPSQITATGGKTLISGNGGLTVRVAQFHYHPQYVYKSRANDVAILRLAAPMTGANIKTAQLCNTSLKAGMNVRLIGWGTLSEQGVQPDRLRTVVLPLIPKNQCVARYRGEERLTPSMFCASGRGKDSCQGDSGGPVMRDGRVCGVVSWGYGCARARYPGVYTSVPRVMPFINNIMNSARG